MILYVNKRMILVINRMCWRKAGGLAPLGKNNLREGCNLGFVDGIRSNEMFGQTISPPCIIRRLRTCFISPKATFLMMATNEPASPSP